MSAKETIISFLTRKSNNACDDCISSKTGIKPRQQVNQYCNELQKEDLIIRAAGNCSCCNKSKIINKMLKGTHSSTAKQKSLLNRVERTAKKTANGRSHIEKPSAVSLTEYLRKWDELENYKLQEASLNLLFNQLCPTNDRIEHVLLKVSALNDFYSTNIFDTYTVAKHILRSGIDIELLASNYSVVNRIAQISIKGKEKNFYSFASKYCSHHKPETFPIYDSFVEKMLLHYQNADEFCSFSKEDLKTYTRFIDVIRSFQSFYKLDKFSLRQIDIFLWLAGKKCFPKRYY